MAGDWMKIELELPDKPEVHSIAAMLNIEPDGVVGKLIRIWQWFDKHTTDGNAYGVTYALPDRISGVTGFGEAMSFVGWLEQKDKVLHMPKFDRHTSESAKKRAQTQKRVAKSRANDSESCNAECNAAGVTKTLPREEKRREVNTSSVPDGFDLFWDAYGKKTGKVNAVREWKKISPSGDLTEKIVSAAAVVAKTIEPKYRKDPERWLRDRRWEDELASETVSDGMPGLIL